jgi:hypothetical protein
MLIDDFSSGCAAVVERVLVVEAGERREETHDFGFRQDVWEDAEVEAELGKSIECQKACFLVSVEVVVRDKGAVHATKYFDHVFILEYFHQLRYLIAALTPVTLRYHLFNGLHELIAHEFHARSDVAIREYLLRYEDH